MKTIAPPRVLALAFCGLVLPAGAQNLGYSDPSASGMPRAPWAPVSGFDASDLPLTAERVPAVKHAEPSIQAPGLLIHGNAAMPVDERGHSSQNPAGQVAANALDTQAPLDEMAQNPAGVAAMNASVEELQLGLALLTSVYRPEGDKVATADCPMLAMVIERRVADDPSKVLEIVESEIALNPNCACEIVKAAIKGCEADVETVSSIVETACVAAPDMMRIISQCAIASAPDSLPQVQEVLAKLDPNAGRTGYSSKSAKDSKAKVVIPGGISMGLMTEAELDTPLDFAGPGKVGCLGLGTAAVVVIDETVSIVDFLHNSCRFFAHESCGQCTPCREGTSWSLRMLERIKAGKGRLRDLDILLELGQTMGMMPGSTICGLADGAAWPIKNAIKKFRGEFEDHIKRTNPSGWMVTDPVPALQIVEAH